MEAESEMMKLAADSNVCRVCLSSDGNNQCIFRTSPSDPYGPNMPDLSVKLQLCSGVEILKNDGLPNSICTKCTLKVNAAHELRELCQRSDVKLRKLYGKTMRNVCAPTVKLHQYCQTDQELSFGVLNEEQNATSNHNGDIIIGKDFQDVEKQRLDQISCQSRQIDCTNEKNERCPRVKLKQVEHEGTFKREAYRTRRMTMFKRVTSMENLRNHKEMQRQYIKKNINSKCEPVEKESPRIVKNTSRSTDRVSNIEPVHKCPKCNRCYATQKSLDRHLSTHGNNKYNCEKCNKHFSRLDKLFEHSKLHKTKEKPKEVLCKICQKSFKKADTMVRHLNVHKRSNPREVFSILKEIRDRRKLENSLTISDLNLQIVSDNCNVACKVGKAASESNGTPRESRKQIPDLENHAPNSDESDESRSESFNSDSRHRCTQCTKCYTSERSLQRHMLIHNEKKFVCNVCNMKFFRQDRLKSHRDRYGHDQDTPCVEPQKPPDDKSAIKLINSWIREELDSDNEGKGFPCTICGKSYDTKKSLIKHQVNAHNTQHDYCVNCGTSCTCSNRDRQSYEKTKPYTCEECNKCFEKEIKLQRHLRIHKRAKEQQDTNFKRFLCHICSKTFRQNTGLMFHMRTHTGYKPHVCKYCGRGFTSNSNCINHERTHTGDRPFVCHFCSAAFAKSCTLKAHITTHTGEANYHCKTCGKSFRRLKYLKEHRFTHTGEKPYACKICGTAYSHSGSLFVHEKKCKAQYNSYQSLPSQNMQNYCEPHTSSPGPTSTITPIVPALPQSHLNNISSTLGSQTSKVYMDSVQRMNEVGTVELVHPGADVSDVASAVRNFAIIGQMFH